MPYQATVSDSTFIIALAVIAAIVVVIIVVATVILLHSEKKKAPLSRLNEEISSIPLDEIVATTPSNERLNIDLPPVQSAELITQSPPGETQIIDLPATSPVDIVTAPTPKENPNNELPSTPPVEIPVLLPSEEKSIIELPSGQRLIRSLWGIFLTTALMFAFTLTLGYIISSYNVAGSLLLLIGLPFGTALAGTIGVRATQLEWRLTIVPALLFVAVAFLLMAIQPFSRFFLVLAILGAVFVPVMNREGKQAHLPFHSLNWVACFILASLLAFWGYSRIRGILGPPLPIPAYFYWFAIIMTFLSPACIAVAWLRLTGTKWLPALLIIPSMPVGVLIILVLSAASG
jgi:hypothetical protein